MFSHLIESSSHAQEFKRRGSFLLFTTATYLVLFVVTGVVSIYAYDAHLDNQTNELELLTFVPPPAPEEVAPEPPRNTIRSTSTQTQTTSQSTRTQLLDSTSNPNNVPDTVSTLAQNVPPARVDSIIGSTNADPISAPAGARGVPGGTGTTPVVDSLPDPPPPPADPPKQVSRIISKGVITSQAISLPKPVYPMIAKQMKIQGTVSIQVLIDESGKVLSAKVLSGSSLLTDAAQKAALQARFSPTKLGDQPVKVSGVITYNFLLNN